MIVADKLTNQGCSVTTANSTFYFVYYCIHEYGLISFPKKRKKEKEMENT